MKKKTCWGSRFSHKGFRTRTRFDTEARKSHSEMAYSASERDEIDGSLPLIIVLHQFALISQSSSCLSNLWTPALNPAFYSTGRQIKSSEMHCYKEIINTACINSISQPVEIPPLYSLRSKSA